MPIARFARGIPAISRSTMDLEESDEEQVVGWGACFSNVMAIFWDESYEWHIPFEKIEDLKYIGAGNQAKIFSGVYKGNMVAVKKVESNDLREAELLELKRLKHESIVEVYGVCNTEPNYCIVMEFCQYGSLFSFLHSGVPLDPSIITKWAKSVANGMLYLHQNNVIHRDLKSPNILLADDLVAKVADFGTSRVWDTLESGMKTFTGTVAWMAPEIIRNEPYNEKVDVWSFGVVLWELMTQAVPYMDLEAPAIMWGVGCNTLHLPIPTDCPEGMRLLIGQCFDRSPNNRPAFKIITAQLEVAAEDFVRIPIGKFSDTVASWRKEAITNMKKEYSTFEDLKDLDGNRRHHFEAVRRLRRIYESQMARANEIYLEACALRLQLDNRENEIKMRELLREDCRCLKRQTVAKLITSSTENVTTNQPMPTKKKSTPVAIVPPKPAISKQYSLVQYVETNDLISRAITSAVSENDLKLYGINPNPNAVKKMPAPVKKIDTVVEYNGNVDEDDFDINDNDGLTAKERHMSGRVDV